MRGAPVVVIDLETTGFEGDARIVEVAIVRFEQFGVQGCQPELLFASLVDPGIPIPAVATAVHGITDAHVRGRPSWPLLWPDVLGMLTSAVPVAHNVTYELRVLEAEARRVGHPGPPPRESWIDTMALSRRLDPEHKSHKLGACCERHGLPRGTHRAAGDAHSTALLLEQLIARLYGDRDTRERLRPPLRPTVAQFLTWSHAKRRRQASPPEPAQPTLPVRQAPQAPQLVVLPPLQPQPQQPIRITGDVVTGFPWCQRADWGRRATVQLEDGTFRRGHLCPPDFESSPACAVVVWEGMEVVVDYVDRLGTPFLDIHGRALLSPSDTGSGGHTLHRQFADGLRRVRTPEQYAADLAAELEHQQQLELQRQAELEQPRAARARRSR